MKTLEEQKFYRTLCDKLKVKWGKSWATKGADLLSFTGENSSQYFRNYFGDDLKRFSPESLATILNALDQTEMETKILTQIDMQDKVLSLFEKLGRLSEKMRVLFDDDDEILKSEISPLLKDIAAISDDAKNFHESCLETKANSI